LGNQSSCLLSPKGEPRCWGLLVPSTAAVTPDASFAEPRTPQGVGVVDMLASNAGGLCVLTGGRVRCAGVGVNARAGDGLTPVELPDAAVRIGVGGSHACAVLADRQVACWGGNLHGQSGEPMGS